MSDRTILLVEDDENQVLLAMRALRKHGIVAEVVVAESGEEAFGYLLGEGSHEGRETFVLPEFVLLSVHLPKRTTCGCWSGCTTRAEAPPARGHLLVQAPISNG